MIYFSLKYRTLRFLPRVVHAILFSCTSDISSDRPPRCRWEIANLRFQDAWRAFGQAPAG